MTRQQVDRSMSPASLAIVLPSLSGGGAERVAIQLANRWAEQGRRVTLITIDAAPAGCAVDPRIVRVGLGLMRVSRSLVSALWNNTLRVRRLRQAIVESGAPCVVSFTDITNVTALLACRDLSVRVIVCERTEPRQHDIGRVWSRLRKRMYRRACAIVVQTDAVREWAETQGWDVPVFTIPNAAPAVSSGGDQPPPNTGMERPAIVALGRLSHEKGVDLLIEAFARIARSHPAWSLYVFGDGAERRTLESLAAQLGVGLRIHFAGWTEDPIAALRSADVFALPSRYEGFPNALLEAMAVGVACVSFDCDSGPREIIRPGVDGLLVPVGDVTALARALDELFSQRELRDRLGTAAREVVQRFSPELLQERWDAVLADCVSPPMD